MTKCYCCEYMDPPIPTDKCPGDCTNKMLLKIALRMDWINKSDLPELTLVE